MTISTTHASNEVTEFISKFVMEYLKFNEFGNDMGSTENSIIMVNRKLTTTAGGEVSIPLVTNIPESEGKVGNSQLEGNETKQNNYGQLVRCEFHREAIAWTKRERKRTAIEALKAARMGLMNWKTALIRNHIIEQLSSITTQSTGVYGVTYTDATAAQKNEYNTNNADRLIYGNALGNTVVGNHAASLANITAADRMSGALLKVMKRAALRTTGTRITPIQVKQRNNEEWLKVYMPSFVFRDFSDDPAVQQAQRDANVRGATNPLFRGGDLIWDGMIVREVKDIPDLDDTGAGSVPLAPVHICGKVAAHVAYAQDAEFPKEERDYGFINGQGIELDYKVRKAVWASNDAETAYKDYGVYTGYLPSVADA